MTLAAQPVDPIWPLLGFLLLIACWFGVVFRTSRLGWRALAMKHPAGQRPAGQSHRVRRVLFGNGVRYDNGIWVVFSEAGIYFYAGLLIRAFHEPFLLPWESVLSAEEDHETFGRSGYRMVVDDAAGGTFQMWLHEKVAEDFSRYHPAAAAAGMKAGGELDGALTFLRKRLPIGA